MSDLSTKRPTGNVHSSFVYYPKSGDSPKVHQQNGEIKLYYNYIEHVIALKFSKMDESHTYHTDWEPDIQAKLINDNRCQSQMN